MSLPPPHTPVLHRPSPSEPWTGPSYIFSRASVVRFQVRVSEKINAQVLDDGGSLLSRMGDEGKEIFAGLIMPQEIGWMIEETCRMARAGFIDYNPGPEYGEN